MCVNARLPVENNDPIGKVRGHDEIVLDNESGLLGVHDESFDDATAHDTLLRIQIYKGESENIHRKIRTSAWKVWKPTGRRLVNEINVGWHAQGQDDCHLFER
jgi:hypothetical protein